MIRRLTLLLPLSLLIAPVFAGCMDADPSESATDTRSPYADDIDNEVRGLPQDEIDGLRSGAGMGYALPAEVNGWPGPLHALESAEELGLVPHQRDDLQDLRQRMLDEAIPLGEEILAVHGRIEEAFRSGDMDDARLQAEVDHLESLYAELRFVHLRTHLEAYPLFTQDQIDAYARLRGYHDVDGDEGDHVHAGH